MLHVFHKGARRNADVGGVSVVLHAPDKAVGSTDPFVVS